MSELVSVAVITYNQKAFIHETMDSILAQTYRPLEIVVADDASTDGTVEILKTYQAAHPEIIKLVLAAENQGITPNSNAAFAACTGEYIAWMGGDDIMFPEKLSKQVEAMRANPKAGLCHHELEVFNSDTGETTRYFCKGRKIVKGGMRDLVKHGAINGACATMVRKEAAPAYGFDPAIPIASDWLHWVECLRDGRRIMFLPDVLGRYRKHVGNVTTVRSKDAFGDHLMSCAIIMKRYPQHRRAALYRLIMVLSGARRHKENSFWDGISMMLYPKIGLRAIAASALYVLSFGKIRR